jgi:phenylalanine-4-hydroxylase
MAMRIPSSDTVARDAPAKVAPPGAAADWTLPQHWERYTAAEHALWDRLFRQQCDLLPSRVTPEFLTGLKLLGMDAPGIPDFERLSERLARLTGWQVVAVPGLVPDEVFFEHLANRRFVAGSFLRKPEQMDYLQEPDVFHDVFGHVPLLAHPVFADYLQAYGRGGQRASGLGVLSRLARLYWYTVEFGLVRSAEGLRIYGAGIVSSRTESIFALEDVSPHRIAFDLRRLMRTRYRIDDFQQTYFVIDSFEDLLEQTLRTDFGPLYAELTGAAEFSPTDLSTTDRILSSGTQNYGKRTPG